MKKRELEREKTLHAFSPPSRSAEDTSTCRQKSKPPPTVNSLQEGRNKIPIYSEYEATVFSSLNSFTA